MRPETAIQAGDVVEACLQRPNTPPGWFTWWLEGGNYPAAGTSGGFSNFYNAAANDNYPYVTTHYVESDNPDGYPLVDGTSAAMNLTPETPYLDAPGSTTNQNYQGGGAINFGANSGGFTYKGFNAGYNWTTDESAGMHCYQMEWVAPVLDANGNVTTVGHAVWSVDGVEYQDKTWNGLGAPMLGYNGTALSSNPPTTASLMLALQYGVTFNGTGSGSAVAGMTPANVASAVAKVYSIRVWKRAAGTAHVAPTLANGAS